MRLLLLAQFFPSDIGGEERHVFNLVNALARLFTASAVAERLEAVYAEVIPQHQSTAGTVALAERDEQPVRPTILKDSMLRRLSMVRR